MTIDFLVLWYLITAIQVFFAYGTAYRLTKNGGDNGVSLFLWLLVMTLAASIPGLGIYLWYQYREDGNPIEHTAQPLSPTAGSWICQNCQTRNEENAQFCKNCGKYK